ncbi:hypothetical protein DMUE_6212, partial [Dictyocoela muelleri]
METAFEEYDYCLRHIEGRKNSDADALSRYLFLATPETYNHNCLIPFPTNINNILKICENSKNKSIKNTSDYKMVFNFLLKMHNELIHPGIRVFEKTLKRFFKIPSLRNFTSKICAECPECNNEKEHMFNKLVTSYAIDINDVNDVVGIDIKGPIQLSKFKNTRKHGEFFILVMMDLFSRYSEIEVIFDTNSETICRS